MAGINSIVDFYNKHGEKALRSFLSNELRITEKYDAHRFSFEKTDKGFVFFGKNGSSALSHVDRTISNLYEAAIQHVENLPKEIKSQIPKGQRFGFYFFPNNKPLNVEYKKQPKNGLILTDLTIRRGDKITESILNHDVIKRWSTVLNTDCDKPLFEGKMSETDMAPIIESVKQGADVNRLFETSSQNPMEGVIIQASTDRGNHLLKFDDPRYGGLVSERKREQVFDILLMNIFEFVETYKLPKIIDENRTDDRYISIICEMFNSYVSKHGKDFLSMGLRKPSFLDKSGKFTTDWIRDRKTISILESNREYEYLLSIFLTNLRKEKKSGGLLSESLTTNFNKIVSDIQELSRGTGDDYAHLEFSNLSEMDYFINKEDKIVEDAPSDDSGAEDMKAISLMQRVFSHTKTNESRGKDEVNVLLGNYTLLTNKDLDMAEAMFKSNGKKVLLVHVSQDKKSGEKFAFETVKVKKMLNKLIDDKSDYLAGADIINAPLLSQVIQGIRPKYEPVAIAINGSTKSLEIEYASRKWLATSYPAGLKFSSYSSGIEKVYKTLEEGSVADFSKLVPDIVSKYFMEYQSEYRKFIYVS